jgi:hypothetical protein
MLLVPVGAVGYQISSKQRQLLGQSYHRPKLFSFDGQTSLARQMTWTSDAILSHEADSQVRDFVRRFGICVANELILLLGHKAASSLGFHSSMLNDD